MTRFILLVTTTALVSFAAGSAFIRLDVGTVGEKQQRMALARQAYDLKSEINDLRYSLAEQDMRISDSETMLDQLVHQSSYRQAQVSGTAETKAIAEPTEMDIGIAMPSAAREREIVDYRTAWLTAMSGQDETDRLAAENASLRQAVAAAQLEVAASDDVVGKYRETVARLESLEARMQTTVANLQSEIEQRESTIVGLVHRIATLEPENGPAPKNGTSASSNAVAAIQDEPTPEATPLDAIAPSAGPGVAAKTTSATASATLAAPEKATVTNGIAAYKDGDYGRAFAIWKPLAETGSASAQYYLGALYYEGRGTARNLDMAYRLLRQSEQAGYSRATELRQRVASEMTGDQTAGLPDTTR